MRFALTHKVITYLVVGISATPVLLSGEIGMGWAFGLIALAGLGWWLEPPLTQNPRIRKLSTVLIFAILAVQLGRFVAGAPMAMLGMEFAAILMGIKLCSRGYAADYHQILVLAFLHIIAGTITTADISYAFSFLFFVLFCPSVLSLSYLRKEIDRRFGESNGANGQKMLERLFHSKRIVTPRFLAGSTLLSLPVLFITGVLFIIFPRIGFGLLGRLPTDKSLAGFGTQVALNDFDLLRQDNTVFIRLEPIGRKRPPRSSIPIRIRGAVFDLYDGNTWKKSKDFTWRTMEPRGNDFSLSDQFINKNDSIGYEVHLESMEPPFVFVPEGTGQISTYPVAKNGVPKARNFKRNALGEISYENSGGVGLRYGAYLYQTSPLGDPPAQDSNNYLQLPPDSDRLVSLARHFSGSGTAQEQAYRIVNRIRQEYEYSTELAGSAENLQEDSPLARFLFSRRTGTCVHFATALTLMLRSVGVPARMATGFLGADWNPIGGYYAVYHRSAHSWTEAYLEGRWQTLDGTPPGDTMSTGWAASTVAMLLDSFRMAWHKRIVSYDAASQFRIAISLREYWITGFRLKKSTSWFSFTPFVVVVLVGAGIGGLIWARKRWRTPSLRTTRSRAARKTHKEVTQLYLYLDKRLALLGYARPFSSTPNEHLRFLSDQAPALASIAQQITQRYNEVRFGGASFVPGEVKELRALIHDLGRARPE